ncbi:hypothetical protein ACS0TY_025737 [Phlomoides rotata]
MVPIPGYISAVYAPFTALFLWFRGVRKENEDLNERLRVDIRRTLDSIISRKEEIDRSLVTSVTKEKSKEYKVMEKDLVLMQKQYAKLISKYDRLTRTLDNPTTEGNPTTELDDSFEEREPKNWTLCNVYKFERIQRDVVRLEERASKVLGNVVPEHMMHSRAEPHHEKQLFDDIIDLPVFNEYVASVSRHLSGNKTKVGIFGPSGVGKTTIMSKLHNQLIDEKRSGEYDDIIWIQEKGTVEKVQTEIMLQLQIVHEKTDSVFVNANRISAFLLGRKYILLMDHVSEKIDLNNLGMLREAHKHGKVVIASSERKEISSMVNDEVEIRRLNTDEAWMLFESICGKVNDRQEGTGRKIVQCCGGLPRQIISVARHLKKHPDERSWNNLKRTLQAPSDSALPGFDHFYKNLYEELQTRHKKCFLYAALFPYEDIIHRDYLIECWMAECFLENDNNIDQKLRGSRDSGQGALDELTSVFLLDWCSDRKRVKMPSICRRVALQQAYPDEEQCSTWVPVDYQKPNDETWNTVTRMSLIGCKTKLPESPKCSNIYTLLLRSKPELENIPDSFFSHMHELLVLDVYGTEIKQLPSSINMLVNLKCLYLNSCKHLEMLPTGASHLVKLQCLDISGTLIPSLPKQISEMVELRCLRASFSPKAASVEEIIPLDIIKNLKKLEELSIDTGLYTPPEENVEELAKELASLEYLTTLCFNFPNFSSFNTFVTQSKSLNNKETTWESSTFRSFRIFVGSCQETQHPYESDVVEVLEERRLRFSLNEESSSAWQEISKQASVFELIGNQSVESLSKFDLHSVEICVVGNCSRLKNIVEAGNAMNGVQESSGSVLKNLKKLHLYDLPLLQCVWEGTVSPQSLIKLVALTLNGCPKLTKIFDLALARALPSLKHLRVEDCCNVSQIVEVPQESSASEPFDLSAMLNSVETIELINLSNLKRICSSTSLSWNSLNSMVIRSCKELCNLSLNLSNANKLASIECDERWWNQLPFSDAAVKERLRPFCKFKEESSELGETSTTATPQYNQASNNNEPGIADHQVSKKNGGNDEERHEENRLIHYERHCGGQTTRHRQGKASSSSTLQKGDTPKDTTTAPVGSTKKWVLDNFYSAPVGDPAQDQPRDTGIGLHAGVPFRNSFEVLVDSDETDARVVSSDTALEAHAFVAEADASLDGVPITREDQLQIHLPPIVDDEVRSDASPPISGSVGLEGQPKGWKHKAPMVDKEYNLRNRHGDEAHRDAPTHGPGPGLVIPEDNSTRPLQAMRNITRER